MPTDLSQIDTVVIVIMENRSFDHMLGYLNLPGPGRIAVDGVSTDQAWIDRHTNYDANHTPYAPHLTTYTTYPDDPPHEWRDIKTQIDAANSANGVPPLDGFVRSFLTVKPPPQDPSYVMSYYGAQTLPVYDFLARNFTVCDRWFSSLPASTQPNRLMAMSGASSIDGNVASLKGIPAQPLAYDWLTSKGVSWCSYQYGSFINYIPFFLLMEKWQDPILKSLGEHAADGPFRKYKYFADAWTGAGDVPSVIFFEPEYQDGPHGAGASNDDHPPCSVANGQFFVADIYNTLVKNPARWAKTVMLVIYDEHGGFFDHVPPIAITETAGPTTFVTTGLRVPALVISPFVEKGAVHSGRLDHTSMLQFLADRFDGGKTYSDNVQRRQQQLSPLSAVLTRTAARTDAVTVDPNVPSAAVSYPPPSASAGAEGHTPSANAIALHAAVARAAVANPAAFAKAMT